MIVDCNECAVRDVACTDCVVTVLLGEPGVRDRAEWSAGSPARITRIDQEERDAISVLADQGLIPRLRLVRSASGAEFGVDAAPRAACDPRRTG